MHLNQNTQSLLIYCTIWGALRHVKEAFENKEGFLMASYVLRSCFFRVPPGSSDSFASLRQPVWGCSAKTIVAPKGAPGAYSPKITRSPVSSPLASEPTSCKCTPKPGGLKDREYLREPRPGAICTLREPLLCSPEHENPVGSMFFTIYMYHV